MKPCPSHTPSHTHSTSSAVTDTLASIVTSLTPLDTCSPSNKLVDVGLDSFDIIRIANEIELTFGVKSKSHDSHMTQLVEKLFDCELGDVGLYVADWLRSSRKRAAEEEDITSIKKLRGGSHVDHVTTCRGSHADHMTDVAVKSWRRGQYFLNGRCGIFAD